MAKKFTPRPPAPLSIEEMQGDVEEHQRAMQSAPDDPKLRGVATLALALFKLEQGIKELTEQLEEAEEQRKRLSGQDLPEAMKEAGMEEFTTTEGLKIQIKNEVAASISEANRPEAHGWLRGHGYEDLIKSQVVVTFGRGEDKARARLVKAVETLGLPYADKAAVHPATLKAFVKECRQNGVAIPDKPFGIYDYKLAKVSVAKR